MLELPSGLVGLIAALVGMLVGEGLQSLGRLLKIDLSGQVAAVTSMIVGLLVASVNGALALIPAQYIPYVQGVLAFLVIVFVPAGIHSVLKKQRAVAG